MRENKKGFTLVELLLVIGIIATLAVVAFVALDPAKRFADARDARRVSDAETILSAVHQYVIDNKGALPSGVDTYERQIGTNVSGCELVNDNCGSNIDYCLDLSSSLSRYLKIVPYDPGNGTPGTSRYTIVSDANNIITVRACDAEGGSISVSR